MCVRPLTWLQRMFFTPVLIAGASYQLKESMLGIAKMSAQLEHLKLQQKIAEETQCSNREKAEQAARARVRAEMAAKRETDKKKKKKSKNPPKKLKKDPVLSSEDVDKDDDEDDEDLELLMEGGKRKQKMPSVAKYAMGAGTGQYATTSEDRKGRILARQEKVRT